MKMSVVIPTHKMDGREDFLKRCLDSLWNQTFQDFEIVVSDNSDDDKLLNICQYYGSINYQRNPIKGMAPNTNHALSRAKGEIIKILYMDDYLAHNNALKHIWNSFDGSWLATGCIHDELGTLINPHKPQWNENIHLGVNTIGSPSVVTVRRKDLIYFDEKMTWLLDCDYYKRMYDLHGAPTLINDINVVIGLGPHQATNTMGEYIKEQEHEYIKQKYA